jgi:hypothetical protein
MHGKYKARSPYYPDVPLFAGLIPFISAFNYYLTYPNISYWKNYLFFGGKAYIRGSALQLCISFIGYI